MKNFDQQHAPLDPVYHQQPGEVARITISAWDNGGVSASGNIGDERLALQMLDAARDAITAHHTRERNKGVVLVPGSMAGLQQDPAFPFGPVCPV